MNPSSLPPPDFSGGLLIRYNNGTIWANRNNSPTTYYLLNEEEWISKASDYNTTPTDPIEAWARKNAMHSISASGRVSIGRTINCSVMEKQKNFESDIREYVDLRGKIWTQDGPRDSGIIQKVVNVSSNAQIAPVSSSTPNDPKVSSLKPTEKKQETPLFKPNATPSLPKPLQISVNKIIGGNFYDVRVGTVHYPFLTAEGFKAKFPDSSTYNLSVNSFASAEYIEY